MQAIMETGFDAAYLITVITLGVLLIKGANDNKQARVFGLMAVILGGGDAFHLLPRAYALWTTGVEANAAALGFGKLVTSITMTIFYVILYRIWQMRYDGKEKKILSYFVYLMAAVRIVLCLFPQNDWFSADAPIIWGIYRNIPFLILGVTIIVLFFQKAREKKDKNFKLMWLAIMISFGFYIPVVLWADTIPLLGMLMIPKTCAYVWIVWMGFREYKNIRIKSV